MERARAIAPITSLQPPYSLVNRKIEPEILPAAAQNGIGVLAYSPMASGLLSGAMTAERVANLPADDWRRRNPNYQEPLLTRNLALVERLRTISDRHGLTPGAVAIAWVLRDPVVTAAIVGARRRASSARSAPPRISASLPRKSRRSNRRRMHTADHRYALPWNRLVPQIA